MNESSLRVIARGRAKPNAIKEIRRIMKPVVEMMRDHEFCQRYELWINDKLDHDFVIYQEWTDQEALKAHLESPAVQEIGYEIGQQVVGPPAV